MPVSTPSSPRWPEGSRGCLFWKPLTMSIRSAAIEVNQDVSRLSSFARTDNAAVFQFIHNARRSGVSEPEAALHQRDARFLFAADDTGFESCLWISIS
jgi:hypothetical protein